jgi:hypothetical protein
MARSRNIKPGFFTNDQLAELPALTRLLFIALWTLVDREGRIEDRPKKIKAEALPYDDGDADQMLQALSGAGFITRYEAGGKRLIQVNNWNKHQNPHVKEQPSEWPAPAQHQTSPVQEPGEAEPSTEQAGLIPDSLSSDSLQEKQPTVAPAQPPVEQPALALVASQPPKPKGPPDCPHQAVLALWAEVLPHLPQHLPSQWRGSRADHLRARWRETAVEKGWAEEAQGLAYLRKLFGYVGQSMFLTGKSPPRGDKRPFVIELEWLVNPTNWAKVHEGKYHQESA